MCIVLLTIFFGICPYIALFKQIEDEFTKTIFWPSVMQIDSDGNDGFVSKGNYTIHHRSIRTKGSPCAIPDKSNYEESFMDCKAYPTRVQCTQICTFGLTFKEGITRTMRCNNDEDRWRPVPEFENCKPFIDCSVKVGPGGKFSCITNYLHKGPNCDISCQRYEDMPGTPEKKYQCDINGEWTPKLPFCAKPKGIDLVPPPKGIKKVNWAGNQFAT